MAKCGIYLAALVMSLALLIGTASGISSQIIDTVIGGPQVDAKVGDLIRILTEDFIYELSRADYYKGDVSAPIDERVPINAKEPPYESYVPIEVDEPGVRYYARASKPHCPGVVVSASS